MRETAALKANRILTEGRLIVEEVTTTRVEGIARGEGHLWKWGYTSGRWWCTCPVTTDQCSHLKAARRVLAVDLEEQR